MRLPVHQILPSFVHSTKERAHYIHVGARRQIWPDLVQVSILLRDSPSCERHYSPIFCILPLALGHTCVNCNECAHRCILFDPNSPSVDPKRVEMLRRELVSPERMRWIERDEEAICHAFSISWRGCAQCDVRGKGLIGSAVRNAMVCLIDAGHVGYRYTEFSGVVQGRKKREVFHS